LRGETIGGWHCEGGFLVLETFSGHISRVRCIELAITYTKRAIADFLHNLRTGIVTELGSDDL
jgi:hypothetical protein